MPQDRKSKVIKVKPSIHRRLKTRASSQGRTLEDVVEDALRLYLRNKSEARWEKKYSPSLAILE